VSDRPRPTTREWLSLGPASRAVGVDPTTLRRWADAGRVVAFTTPGGHRRFDRKALERLAAARRPGPRLPLSLLGATPDRFSRAYRRSYRVGSPGGSAATTAAGPDRAAFRQDGRLLVEALLAYLDAPGSRRADPSDPSGPMPTAEAWRADAERANPERATAEHAAVALTDDLARRLAGSSVSLTDAVELFVAARRPFLAELGLLAGRRGLEPTALAGLYEDAAGLLDRLLLRLIATHQAAASDKDAAPAGDAESAP